MNAAGERLSALAGFAAVQGTTKIRPIRPSDAEVLFGAVHQRPEVTRWLCWEGPVDQAEMQDRYQAWFRGLPEEPILILAIEQVSTGTAIGELTLRFDGHPGVGDLGYWLDGAHHGRGHGTRALHLAIEFAFEQLGARVLTASVKEGNDGSIALLKGEGFQLEPAPNGGSSGTQGAPADDGPPIAWYSSLTRRSWSRNRASE